MEGCADAGFTEINLDHLESTGSGINNEVCSPAGAIQGEEATAIRSHRICSCKRNVLSNPTVVVDVLRSGSNIAGAIRGKDATHDKWNSTAGCTAQGKRQRARNCGGRLR